MSRRAEPLDRGAVVAAACRVARSVGLESVTMRSVAAELDVTPMALYHYVDGKDELIKLVIEEVVANLPGRPSSVDGWQSGLRDYLVATWEHLTDYPGVSAHLLSQPTLGVTEQTTAQGVAFLEEAGFSPAEARLGWAFALTWLHGRLSVDAHLRDAADPAVRIGGGRARDHAAYGAATVVTGLAHNLT